MTQIALERISNLQPPPFQNHAIHFASQANSSEAARLDAQFQEDFIKVLSGNCIYLKNFLGRANDMSILNGLVDDLVKAQAVGEGGGDGVSSNEHLSNSKQQPDFSKMKKAVITDSKKPNYAAMNDNDDGKNTSSSTNSNNKNQTMNPKTKAQQEGDDLRVGLQNWGKHQMFNKVDHISPTFNALVEFLSDYFDTTIHASRLNVYKDGNEWKYKHHDSHAYSKKHNEAEDFTIGISFGHARALTFYHDASGRKFDIPQANCDLFAFTSTVNDVFMHGVEKDGSRQAFEMPRLSLIVWGKRRSLNERNGGGASLPKHLMSKFDRFAVGVIANNNNHNNLEDGTSMKKKKIVIGGSASNNQQNKSSSSSTMGSRQVSHQNDDGSLTEEAKDCVVDVAKSLVSAKSNSSMGEAQSSTASASSNNNNTKNSAVAAKKKKNRLQ